MQRMIPHARPLPKCRAGHTARHIHDRRCASAGGGHFVECACRQGARFPQFEAALADWCAINGHQVPAPAFPGRVFRLKPA